MLLNVAKSVVAGQLNKWQTRVVFTSAGFLPIHLTSSPERSCSLTYTARKKGKRFLYLTRELQRARIYN